MRIITLEEHFASPAFLAGAGKAIQLAANNPENPRAGILGKLADLDEGRIAAMDAAGIDVQVLSLNSPGAEQLAPAEATAVARETNDFLAEAVQRHPERFAGFATLPAAVPERAAEELERTVRHYGFRGALINGHIRGRYLDDPFFRPLLERAESLQVPIYLHPTQSPQPALEALYKGFDPAITGLLEGPGWGWHIETALHLLRIILGRVFDRYARLQIVVGHMGETLPFMLQRFDRVFLPSLTKLRRPVSAYLRENVHYTFSGFNFMSVFLNLLLQVGAERILFSTDYPYQSMAEGRAFLDQIPVSDADRERIAHGNAEHLLGL